MQKNYKKFPIAIRAISFILIIAFLAQDIVWANPDALQVQLRTATSNNDFKSAYYAQYLVERARNISELIDKAKPISLDDITRWQNATSDVFDVTTFTVVADERDGLKEILIRIGDNHEMALRYARDFITSNDEYESASYWGLDNEYDNTLLCRQLLISNVFIDRLRRDVKSLPGPKPDIKPSMVAAANKGEFSDHFRRAAIIHCYDKVRLSKPSKAIYEKRVDEVEPRMPKPKDNDWRIYSLRIEKLKIAAGVLREKGKELKDSVLTGMAKRLEETIEIIGLEGMPTNLFYFDLTAGLYGATHGGRSRSVIYMPANLPDHFDIDIIEDMEGLAMILYREMRFLDKYNMLSGRKAGPAEMFRGLRDEKAHVTDERERSIGNVERLNVKLRTLAEEDNKISGTVKLAIIERLMNQVDNRYLSKKWKKRMRKKGIDENWEIKILKRNIEGTHIFLFREDYIELANKYGRIGNIWEDIGDRSKAEEFYYKRAETLKLIQYFDNGDWPVRLEEQLALFFLRMGMYDDFLKELKALLKGEDFRVYLGAEEFTRALDVGEEEFRKTFVRNHLDKLRNEILYTLLSHEALADKAQKKKIDEISSRAIMLFDEFEKSLKSENPPSGSQGGPFGGLKIMPVYRGEKGPVGITQSIMRLLLNGFYLNFMPDGGLFRKKRKKTSTDNLGPSIYQYKFPLGRQKLEGDGLQSVKVGASIKRNDGQADVINGANIIIKIYSKGGRAFSVSLSLAALTRSSFDYTTMGVKDTLGEAIRVAGDGLTARVKDYFDSNYSDSEDKEIAERFCAAIRNNIEKYLARARDSYLQAHKLPRFGKVSDPHRRKEGKRYFMVKAGKASYFPCRWRIFESLDDQIVNNLEEREWFTGAIRDVKAVQDILVKVMGIKFEITDSEDTAIKEKLNAILDVMNSKLIRLPNKQVAAGYVKSAEGFYKSGAYNDMRMCWKSLSDASAYLEARKKDAQRIYRRLRGILNECRHWAIETNLRIATAADSRDSAILHSVVGRDEIKMPGCEPELEGIEPLAWKGIKLFEADKTGANKAEIDSALKRAAGEIRQANILHNFMITFKNAYYDARYSKGGDVSAEKIFRSVWLKYLAKEDLIRGAPGYWYARLYQAAFIHQSIPNPEKVSERISKPLFKAASIICRTLKLNDFDSILKARSLFKDEKFARTRALFEDFKIRLKRSGGKKKSLDDLLMEEKLGIAKNIALAMGLDRNDTADLKKLFFEPEGTIGKTLPAGLMSIGTTLAWLFYRYLPWIEETAQDIRIWSSRLFDQVKSAILPQPVFAGAPHIFMSATAPAEGGSGEVKTALPENREAILLESIRDFAMLKPRDQRFFTISEVEKIFKKKHKRKIGKDIWAKFLDIGILRPVKVSGKRGQRFELTEKAMRKRDIGKTAAYIKRIEENVETTRRIFADVINGASVESAAQKLYTHFEDLMKKEASEAISFAVDVVKFKDYAGKWQDEVFHAGLIFFESIPEEYLFVEPKEKSLGAKAVGGDRKKKAPSKLLSDISLYLSNISKHPLLTRLGEITLAARAQGGDLQARRLLWQSNLRLVVLAARAEMRRHHSSLNLMDHIDNGNYGVYEAIDKYEPQSGFRFSTYASWWIRRTIRREIVRQGLGSITMSEHYFRRWAIIVEKCRKKGVYPIDDNISSEEIAEITGMTLRTVVRSRKKLKISSLNAANNMQHNNRGSDNDDEFIELANIIGETDEQIAMFDLLNALEDVIAEFKKRLTGWEKTVWEMRILPHLLANIGAANIMTLQGIGNILGLSRERVRLIEKKLIKRLRNVARDKGMGPGKHSTRPRRPGKNKAHDINSGDANDIGKKLPVGLLSIGTTLAWLFYRYLPIMKIAAWHIRARWLDTLNKAISGILPVFAAMGSGRDGGSGDYTERASFEREVRGRLNSLRKEDSVREWDKDLLSALEQIFIKEKPDGFKFEVNIELDKFHAEICRHMGCINKIELMARLRLLLSDVCNIGWIQKENADTYHIMVFEKPLKGRLGQLPGNDRDPSKPSTLPEKDDEDEVFLGEIGKIRIIRIALVALGFSNDAIDVYREFEILHTPEDKALKRKKISPEIASQLRRETIEALRPYMLEILLAVDGTWTENQLVEHIENRKHLNEDGKGIEAPKKAVSNENRKYRLARMAEARKGGQKKREVREGHPWNHKPNPKHLRGRRKSGSATPEDPLHKMDGKNYLPDGRETGEYPDDLTGLQTRQHGDVGSLNGSDSFFSLEPRKLIAELQSERTRAHDIVSQWPKAFTSFGSARIDEGHPIYEKAAELGRLLYEEGFTVRTGAGPSIMEAVLKGCIEARDEAGAAKTVENSTQGCRILLPFEKEANSYVEEVCEVDRFAVRKPALIENSAGFFVFPGGFGTIDELFDALLMGQTMVLMGKSFWQPVIDSIFKDGGEYNLTGLIKRPYITDDIDDAIGYLEKHPNEDIQPDRKALAKVNEEMSAGITQLSQWKSAVIFTGNGSGNEMVVAKNLASSLASGGIPIRSSSKGALLNALKEAASGKEDMLQAVLHIPKAAELLAAGEPSLSNLIGVKDISNYHVMCTENSRAFVFLPGADTDDTIRTLNSLFDIITVTQTRKVPRRPIILIGKKFWEPIMSSIIDSACSYSPNLISPEDTELFKIIDTADEAFALVGARTKSVSDDELVATALAEDIRKKIIEEAQFVTPVNRMWQIIRNLYPPAEAENIPWYRQPISLSTLDPNSPVFQWIESSEEIRVNPARPAYMTVDGEMCSGPNNVGMKIEKDGRTQTIGILANHGEAEPLIRWLYDAGFFGKEKTKLKLVSLDGHGDEMGSKSSRKRDPADWRGKTLFDLYNQGNRSYGISSYIVGLADILDLDQWYFKSIVDKWDGGEGALNGFWYRERPRFFGDRLLGTTMQFDYDPEHGIVTDQYVYGLRPDVTNADIDYLRYVEDPREIAYAVKKAVKQAYHSPMIALITSSGWIDQELAVLYAQLMTELLYERLNEDKIEKYLAKLYDRLQELAKEYDGKVSAIRDRNIWLYSHYKNVSTRQREEEIKEMRRIFLLPLDAGELKFRDTLPPQDQTEISFYYEPQGILTEWKAFAEKIAREELQDKLLPALKNSGFEELRQLGNSFANQEQTTESMLAARAAALPDIPDEGMAEYFEHTCPVDMALAKIVYNLIERPGDDGNFVEDIRLILGIMKSENLSEHPIAIKHSVLSFFDGFSRLSGISGYNFDRFKYHLPQTNNWYGRLQRIGDRSKFTIFDVANELEIDGGGEVTVTLKDEGGRKMEYVFSFARGDQRAPELYAQALVNGYVYLDQDGNVIHPKDAASAKARRWDLIDKDVRFETYRKKAMEAVERYLTPVGSRILEYKPVVPKEVPSGAIFIFNVDGKIIIKTGEPFDYKKLDRIIGLAPENSPLKSITADSLDISGVNGALDDQFRSIIQNSPSEHIIGIDSSDIGRREKIYYFPDLTKISQGKKPIPELMASCARFLRDIEKESDMKIVSASLIGSYGWGFYTPQDDLDILLITEERIDPNKLWALIDRHWNGPIGLEIHNYSRQENKNAARLVDMEKDSENGIVRDTTFNREMRKAITVPPKTEFSVREIQLARIKSRGEYIKLAVSVTAPAAQSQTANPIAKGGKIEPSSLSPSETLKQATPSAAWEIIITPDSLVPIGNRYYLKVGDIQQDGVDVCIKYHPPIETPVSISPDERLNATYDTVKAYGGDIQVRFIRLLESGAAKLEVSGSSAREPGKIGDGPKGAAPAAAAQQPGDVSPIDKNSVPIDDEPDLLSGKVKGSKETDTSASSGANSGEAEPEKPSAAAAEGEKGVPLGNVPETANWIKTHWAQAPQRGFSISVEPGTERIIPTIEYLSYKSPDSRLKAAETMLFPPQASLHLRKSIIRTYVNLLNKQNVVGRVALYHNEVVGFVIYAIDKTRRQKRILRMKVRSGFENKGIEEALVNDLKDSIISNIYIEKIIEIVDENDRRKIDLLVGLGFKAIGLSGEAKDKIIMCITDEEVLADRYRAEKESNEHKRGQTPFPSPTAETAPGKDAIAAAKSASSEPPAMEEDATGGTVPSDFRHKGVRIRNLMAHYKELDGESYYRLNWSSIPTIGQLNEFKIGFRKHLEPFLVECGLYRADDETWYFRIGGQCTMESSQFVSEREDPFKQYRADWDEVETTIPMIDIHCHPESHNKSSPYDRRICKEVRVSIMGEFNLDARNARKAMLNCIYTTKYGFTRYDETSSDENNITLEGFPDALREFCKDVEVLLKKRSNPKNNIGNIGDGSRDNPRLVPDTNPDLSPDEMTPKMLVSVNEFLQHMNTVRPKLYELLARLEPDSPNTEIVLTIKSMLHDSWSICHQRLPIELGNPIATRIAAINARIDLDKTAGAPNIDKIKDGFARLFNEIDALAVKFAAPAAVEMDMALEQVIPDAIMRPGVPLVGETFTTAGQPVQTQVIDYVKELKEVLSAEAVKLTPVADIPENLVDKGLILYADDILERGAAIDLQQTLTTTDRLNGSTMVIYERNRGTGRLLKEIIDGANKSIKTILVDEATLIDTYGRGDIYVNEASALECLIKHASAQGINKKDLVGVIKDRRPDDDHATQEDVESLLSEHKIPVVYFGGLGACSFNEAVNILLSMKKSFECGEKNIRWYRELPPITRTDMQEIYNKYKSLLEPALSA